jgi:RNA polymerase sigma factor (sigma-70 family)
MAMEPEAPFALNELLAEAGWARRLAAHLVRDPEGREELLQDVWRRALDRPPIERTATHGPRAWLATVMRNLATSRRRDAERRTVHEERASKPEAWSPTDVEARVDLQRRLAEAVAGLDEPYRSVIALRYFDELSLAEIARRQGVSHAAARQRASRGLATLRARLDREFGDRSAWSALLLGFAGKHATSVGSGVLLMSIKWKLVAAALVVAASVVGWNVLHDDTDAESDLSVADPGLAESVEPVTDGSTKSEARELIANTPAVADAPPAIDRDRDLHGEVVDLSGTPVAGATVEVYRDDSMHDGRPDSVHRTKLAEQVTDSDGRFKIPLDLGRPFDVDVLARGFAVEHLTALNAGEHVRITLHAPSSVSGIVTNARDGLPIAEVRLMLAQRNAERPPPRIAFLETVTDPSGRFRFDGLPSAVFHIQTLPSDVAPVESEFRSVEVADGQQLEVNWNVALHPTAPLRGRIVDDVTGAPVVGAAVGAPFGQALTDEHGEFVALRVPTDQHFTVYVRADGFGLASRDFEPLGETPEPQAVEFRLPPNRRARGRVLDEHGEPIEGARICFSGMRKTAAPRPTSSLERSSTISRADGTFESNELGARTEYGLLVVSKEGYGTLFSDFPPDEFEKKAIEFDDIVLRPMAVVRGSVVDEDGRGVPGKALVLSIPVHESESNPLRRHEGSRTAWTDDLGRFAFADVRGGEYELDIGADRFDRLLPPPPVHVVAVDGARIDDLRFVLPLDSTISGRVFDEHGACVPYAWISADGEATRSTGTVGGDTDADGRFSIFVQPGEYTLSVRASVRNLNAMPRRNFAVTTFPGVKAGTRDLELRLAPTVWIRGRVLDADGNGVPKAYVEANEAGERIASSSFWTESDGTFELAILAGHVAEVEVHAPAGPGSGIATFTSKDPVLIPNVAPGGEELVVRLPKPP